MILALLMGCEQPDFAREWQLDRLRLLAVAAEPAEPRPGDRVSFRSLVYAPDELEWSAVWVACVDGDTEGCTLDEALLERLAHADELGDAELLALLGELQAAGFVGIEPGLMLGWLAPEDALEGLDPEARLEGRSATVTVNLATEDDAELVLKSIPVSEATTPNTNPELGSFTLAGAEVQPDATVAVGTLTQVDVVATLAGELESYVYVTTAGVTETRTEVLEFRWYTSGGTLEAVDEGFRIGDDETATRSERRWTSPETPGDYRLDVVVLDGRGGMGWRSHTVQVR